MGVESSPLGISIAGLGEVFIDYANEGIQELEQEGVLKIINIAGRKSLEERLKFLEEQCKQYPKKRKSTQALIDRVRSGDIRYVSTNNQELDNKTAEEFYRDTDFVYLATPNNVREQFVQQAANRGKHVIVEKPLGTTRGSVGRLQDIAKGKIKSACMEHYSYKPPTTRMLQLLQHSNDFGKIQSVEAVLEEEDFLERDRYKWLLEPAKSGGGMWIDTGIHLMHLIRLLGLEPGRVIWGEKYQNQFSEPDPRNDLIKSETAADVYFNLNGNNATQNARAHLRVAKCMPEHHKTFQVNFRNNQIFLDFDNNTLYTFNRQPTQSTL